MSKSQTDNGNLSMAAQAAGGVDVPHSKRSKERESLSFFRSAASRFVTSLLLYGLIVEWLLPLEQLQSYTELYTIGPLLAAVGVFLLVGLFVPPTWLALPLNGCVAIATAITLFKPHYGSFASSWSGLARAFRLDAAGVAGGNFMLTGEMRTLLLICGLGMMTIAVQSLMWLRQWGLGLTALTAVYLMILYGFMGLEVFPGLLRACVEGLLLSALVTQPRIERLTGLEDIFGKGRILGERQENKAGGEGGAASQGGAVVQDGEDGVAKQASAMLQDRTLLGVNGFGLAENGVRDTGRADDRAGAGKEHSRLAGWSLGWWSGSAWLAAGIIAISFGAAWALSNGTHTEPAPWADQAIAWGERLGSGDGGSPASSMTAEEAMAESGLGGSSGKTGYGFDESRLGGPLVPDDKVLFTVKASEAGYLRGDSLSYYNGKGWEQNDHGWQKLSVKSATAGKGGNAFLQTVTPAKPTVGYPLFSGGADARIVSLTLRGVAKGTSGKYWRDADTGALFPPGDENRVVRYTVSTNVPDEEAARMYGVNVAGGSVSDGGASVEGSGSNGSNGASEKSGDVGAGGTNAASYGKGDAGIVTASTGDSDSLSGKNTNDNVGASEKSADDNVAEAGSSRVGAADSRKDVNVVPALTDQETRAYTQLPNELPERVGELAAQIFADAGSGAGRYAQAEAVVDYLRSSYAYTLTNTKVPPAGADFVDDFLFEQKQGYCVHFATAMTVLLRTQGIPARYVKGFAPGEADTSVASDAKRAMSQYTVRASDAHAWVEVWFPGVGWVTFEPTPGFAAPVAGTADASVSSVGADEAAEPGVGAVSGVDDGGGKSAGASAQASGGQAGRLAAKLRGAEASVRQGAHALAAAGRGVWSAPAWAQALCAAIAVGAAGLALTARRTRERFAFAAALRRYGSAVAAGRHTAARGQFLQLADALWRELYKRCGAKPPHRTSREYAAALELPPHTAPLVAAFVRWDEAARFGAAALELPPPERIAELVAAVRAAERTQPAGS